MYFTLPVFFVLFLLLRFSGLVVILNFLFCYFFMLLFCFILFVAVFDFFDLLYFLSPLFILFFFLEFWFNGTFIFFFLLREAFYFFLCISIVPPPIPIPLIIPEAKPTTASQIIRTSSLPPQALPHRILYAAIFRIFCSAALLRQNRPKHLPMKRL